MLPCYRLSSILLLQMTNKPREEEEGGGGGRMLPCYRPSSILLLQMTNKPREEEEGGCYLVHQRFVHQILPAAQPQGTIAPTVAHTKDNMPMHRGQRLPSQWG